MIRDREKIEKLARLGGFCLEDAQDNIGLLIFRNGGVQVNVYTTRMTVGTSLAHPTKGKTQLWRKCVTFQELERIFKNPRAHTGLGYYERTR